MKQLAVEQHRKDFARLTLPPRHALWAFVNECKFYLNYCYEFIFWMRNDAMRSQSAIASKNANDSNNFRVRISVKGLRRLREERANGVSRQSQMACVYGWNGYGWMSWHMCEWVSESILFEEGNFRRSTVKFFVQIFWFVANVFESFTPKTLFIVKWEAAQWSVAMFYAKKMYIWKLL